MDARKHVEEMIAEGLREVGVLITVFAILDKMVAGSITAWWTVTALAVGALFSVQGCISNGGVPLAEYTSLGIGVVFGALVFASTVLWMNRKVKPRTSQTGLKK